MSIVSFQSRRAMPSALRLAASSLLLVVLGSLPAASQQKNPATKAEQTPEQSVAPVIWAQPAPPTEANIAAILMAADESAVKDAKLAESKSSDPKVQSFAKTVASDHTALEQRAVTWMKDKKIEPVESSPSRGFTARGVKSRGKLETLDAAHFDRSFVVEQIGFDKSLLAALKDIMIPNAKDAQLASLLKTARPQVEAHLKAAQQLESSLKA
jgi:putative membrane protein